jgi:hypothetical protein
MSSRFPIGVATRYRQPVGESLCTSVMMRSSARAGLNVSVQNPNRFDPADAFNSWKGV